jgi:hypothetical protein
MDSLPPPLWTPPKPAIMRVAEKHLLNPSYLPINRQQRRAAISDLVTRGLVSREQALVFLVAPPFMRKATAIGNAVDYNGTTDYLSKTTQLTAATPGKAMFSCWIRIDGGNGTSRRIFHQNLGVDVSLTTGNKVQGFFNNSTSSRSFTIVGSTSLTSGVAWHHIAMSIDVGLAAGSKIGQIYVDGVAETVTKTDANPAFVLGVTDPNTNIASAVGPSLYFNGALAEVYLSIATQLDLATNITKFRTAAGKPEVLGVDGSTPTGTAAIVYLNNPAATIGTNKGTGGNFTVNGTPADASTTPF